jgi:site-specific DNA-methyltransferase (adenine-specific)
MMEPYWTDGERTIYHGDCMQVLPLLADASVDMIFCDPPYGLEFNSFGRSGDPRPIANDSLEWFARSLPRIFRHFPRLLKRGGCCCCCCCGGGPRPIFAEMTMMLDGTPGLSFKQAVVWDKRGLGMGWHYRPSYEFVLVAQKKGGPCRWFGGKKQSNVVRIPRIIPRADQHPTEKPIELPEMFIRLHSEPGDLVLDCFMGRGSTGVAAKRLGRRFIGIEVEERYCADGAGRMGAQHLQVAGGGHLFAGMLAGGALGTADEAERPENGDRALGDSDRGTGSGLPVTEAS